jgi:ABC-type transport system involved in multi-copper enzyme maturation permease subunit
MSAFLSSVGHRLRGWRAPVLLVLLVSVALVLSVRWLTLTQQAILWALVSLAVTVAVRTGQLKLFGPVLFYDLVRSARRLRFVLVRTLYAVFVGFILCWLFFMVVVERGWRQPAERMSDFATNFLYVFLSVQFFTVVLLTPAYCAGAVAEEKERKTIQFILATDLLNREIILGKVLSRLLNLSLLLLAGIPILAFLQFLGGVDIGVVLAGFVATALTMYSLAGLSLLNSVLCRRARDAIVMTYLMAVAYYLLAGGALLVVYGLSRSVLPGLEHFPSTDTWTSPVEVGDLVDWFNAGNIGYAVYRLGRGASASAVFEQELPGVLGGYLAFHGIVGTACLAWATLRLRALALREEVRRSVRAKGALVRARRRPRVGRHPMIWKEVFAEGGLRLNSLGRIVAGVLVIAGFLPAIITLWVYFDGGFGRMTWHDVNEVTNGVQMRFVGTVVACLMLLAVVVRAAGSVRSERERSTFDELLTTRLTNNEILFGKWLGAVLSVRWAWAWLGLIWAVSVALGGVQVFCLPVILIAWAIYAAVGAGVGLWFSIGSKSSLRAIVASLATMIFICGGHWLVTLLFCVAPMAALGVRPGQYDWIMYLEAGQTPPFVMAWFAFRGDEFDRAYDLQSSVRFTIASLFGLGCWAGLVPVLWLLVKRRFEQVTGRTPHLRPERLAPRPRRRPEARKALVIDAEPPANGQEGEGQILTVLPVDVLPVEEKEGEAKGPPP